MVSTGFNGYPSGITDNESDSREVKLAKTIHAELNAILYSKQDLTGCTLYVTPIPPCSACAAVIAQSGISKVIVGRKVDLDISRWDDSINIALDIFKEKGIIFLEVFV